MGAITIKIPQNTTGTFEITDRDAADKLIRQLKKSAVGERKPQKKDEKDFAELSKWLKKYLENPDNETLDAIKTAEEWRKKWDR